MSSYKRVVLTLDANVLADVQRRMDLAQTRGRGANNLSGEISEALARYYECLRRARAALKPRLSVGECAALIDVSNGTIYQSYSIPLIWAEIQDALPDGLAEKWGIDGPALVGKLRLLTYGEQAALVDACERWWRTWRVDQPADYGSLLD